MKWPNDIWVNERKIGGILIELSGEQAGPCQVVVGLGLNLLMRRDAVQIDQDWTSLAMETSAPIARNQTTAAVIAALVSGLKKFERDGFVAFRDRWEALDVLRGRSIQLLGVQPREGISRGIGRFGHLLIQTENGLEEVGAGEVSLRPI